MKKLILLFLLTTYISFSQTVNYTTDSSIFSNPERGLQKYSKNVSSSGTYSLINQATLTSWRTGTDKITVIYRYLMLGEFISNNSVINSTYLSNVQTDFNRIRNAGLKVIIRPAYTTNYDAVVQPNKQTIINHISQLSAIINANKDIIVSVQCGFIGVYGEWYYTGGSTSSDTDGSPEFGDEGNISNTQWLNRKEVVDAMLSNFGNLPIQVRYATAKRKMYGSTLLTDVTAYQNTPLARVGFYNDAFLNEDGDMGTYEISNCVNPVGTSDYNFIANASEYLPMNGETNGINPCNSGLRTTGANAVVELDALNFSTLNRDYFPDAWNDWITSGHYNTILKNLGYRLQLNSTTVNIGTTIDFTMNITNTGYGNVTSNKNVYLVFRNTSGIEYKKLLTVDPRFWRTTHSFSQSLVKDIPDGQYSLYLHIADPNLESRPEYSIKLANSDIVFEATTGYNNLNQTINIINAGCAITTWDGSSWSAGIPLSNRTAVINGLYDTSNDGSIDCCDLIVTSGASLIITSGEYCSVSGDIITVDAFGSLLVKSGGSLIPISPACVSTGIINIERKTTSMKRYDYTYWSAPVNCSIGNSLLATKWEPNHTYTFNTSNFFDIETRYQNTFLSNLPDGQDDNDDAWTNVLPSDIMVKGKGYISMIKSLIPTGTYPRIETVNFIGQLNTGVITTPIGLSANLLETNDDKNLVGNPFPAAINSNDFIDANITNISGTLFFWTHTNTLSTSYSGLEMFNFSVNDYARYTKLGGVAATFGGKVPTNVIGSCQGFFVEAENNTNLVFPPSLMSNAYINTTAVSFFRTQEINKVWLNMSTSLGLFSQQLIGYRDDTSLAYDKGFDAKILIAKTPIKFYSIENGDKYDIQARGTYNLNDVVKLGYETAVAETFTISIDSLNNIDNVYIKDNGVLHNLPYTFTSEIGEFNDRFELVYTNLLPTDIPAANSEIVVYPNPTNNNLYIKNFKGKILKVYNILGKTYKVEYTKYNENTIIVNTNTLNKGLYLLRLDNKTIRFIKI